MGNTPQRVATSVKGNWKLRHPHLQDITHFYGILSGKTWILSIGMGYLDVSKMSPFPVSPLTNFPSR